MKAVVLAGGFGTRLRPLTIEFPKPMALVGNAPMMEHVLGLLKEVDVDDVYVMLYYQPEVIKGYFGEKKYGLKLNYILPQKDLGTCGCVKFIEDKLNETFIVLSGDVLTDFDLKKAYEFHKKKKSKATIVLTRVSNPLSFGIVITDEDGRIVRFLEKPTWGEVFSDTINTGIYILEPDVLRFVPKDTDFDFSKDLYPLLLKNKVPIYGCILDGYWKDVGNLRQYLESNLDFVNGKIRIKGKGKFVGNSFFGENVKIGKGVKIDNSVIGDGVKIGDSAVIKDSVIYPSVEIERKVKITRAVLSYRVKVGELVEVKNGSVISDNCIIGRRAVIGENVKIWPDKVVDEDSILTTSLIWRDRWQNKLFGNFGITGLINKEITPEFATKLGASIGAYLGEGSYVLTSRDAHQSSRMIKRAIINGLISVGVKVGDMRVSPIPVVRYEIGKEQEAGGIHVRRSPFDGRVVDILIFNNTGGNISARQEKSIEQLFFREDFVRVSPDKVGHIVIPPRAYDYYVDGFLHNIDVESIRKRRFKIVLDYSFSPASIIFPQILGKLNIEVIALNSHIDPEKTSRLREEYNSAVKNLSSIIKTVKADIGFMLDNGAEKIMIFDERGRVISGEKALYTVIKLMSLEKKGKVVVPVNAIKEIEGISGIKVEYSPVHPRSIMEYAKKEDVIFAGDNRGGYIFTEFQPNYDAMFAIGKILEIMSKNEIKISDIVKEIPEYKLLFSKVSCPNEAKGMIMRKLMEFGKKKRIVLIDGVKFLFKSSWVLAIPDQDTSFINIWVEAKSNNEAKRIIENFEKRIKNWLKGI
ncbi:MAG: nucleotidyltransferase [Caldiserica bacterium]|nr:MAG: nucleotidyltransferase [Caldisericota bacterium]